MPSVDTETQIVPMSGLYSEHGPLRPVLSRVKSSPAKNPGALPAFPPEARGTTNLHLDTRIELAPDCNIVPSLIVDTPRDDDLETGIKLLKHSCDACSRTLVMA